MGKVSMTSQGPLILSLARFIGNVPLYADLSKGAFPPEMF